jgi:hypothetical protein
MSSNSGRPLSICPRIWASLQLPATTPAPPALPVSQEPAAGPPRSCHRCTA